MAAFQSARFWCGAKKGLDEIAHTADQRRHWLLVAAHHCWTNDDDDDESPFINHEDYNDMYIRIYGSPSLLMMRLALMIFPKSEESHSVYGTFDSGSEKCKMLKFKNHY